MRVFYLSLIALVATASFAQSPHDIHVRVDPNGPGSISSTTDYLTIQQALDHAPEPPAPYRLWIEIVPGIYHERIDVTQNRPRVTLLGLGTDPSAVVITNSFNAKQAGGTFFTETAQINGPDFEADNLTFENTAGPTGQAVAAAVRSDRAVFKHCRFLGDQDTLFADFGRQYYVDSYISGGVDFIFGNAAAVFDHSEIHIIRPGFLTAQSCTSPTQPTGYVIDNSRVTSSIETPPPANPAKTVRTGLYLGRPWRLYSRVVVMNTELPADLTPAAWSVWNKSEAFPPKAFYATFNDSGPGWRPTELAPWSHQLTAREAAAFAPRAFLASPDHWNPIAAAAALPDPPVQLTSEQDRQRLLGLLGIHTPLRPGVNGDGKGSNPVNYDEANGGPTSPLPDPLKLTNGRKVTTAAQWVHQRRPQLVKLFAEDVYGRMPAHTPGVAWRITSETHETIGDTPALVQHLIGHVDNSADPLINVDIELILTTPAAPPHPVPVIMEFSFDFKPRPGSTFHFPPPPHPTPIEQTLARGWAYAQLYPYTVQPDSGAGLTSGIIGLVNHGQPRSIDDWGALRAWAWGASRALDYFATIPTLDPHRVAITGHSRFGKAALVTMAFDPRFAIGYISSSGAGGAAPARRNFGESLENVAAANEYHWMGARYLRYAGPLTPADLPVDSNELIALCAPRPVFIGGGTAAGGDGWVDTRGMFLAEAAASPVYRLLGVRGLVLEAKGLGTDTFPPVSTLLDSGTLAFRQQPGGHTPLPNFPYFLDFAARFFSTSATPSTLASNHPTTLTLTPNP